VAERTFSSSAEREPVEIASAVAHASRIYDYLLGGSDNFEADRQAAEKGFSAYPGGVDGARADARANRAFLRNAVEHMAGEGIRQFLDIGTGIPNADNAHAVAREVAPDSYIVYVDNDPIVLAHSHALLKDQDPDMTAYIDGDLRQPEKILRQAADTLDFSKPVGLLLIGIMHVIPDSDAPHAIVSTLTEVLAPGSFLAVSQMASDVRPEEMAKVVADLAPQIHTTNPVGFRSRDDIRRFFDGFELVGPGLVSADRWRATASASDAAGAAASAAGEREVPLYCGVGRKS
jgi:hypothetical protein